MINSILKRIRHYKDHNPFMYLCWLKLCRIRGKYEIRKKDDITAIRHQYIKYCGSYPDLNNPHKFSEKLQWLKLNYYNELMPICADKYAVREYLKGLGFDNLLNDLIAVYDKSNINDFSPDKLPDKFVLKATHGSGWNLVVTDKKSVNWCIWGKILKDWLNQDFFWTGREWPYQKITPRIICEKYLEDNSGGLMDYKFYCMNGSPKFLQVNRGRGTLDMVQNYYDLNWNIMPFGKTIPYNPNAYVEKPAHFEQMIKIAYQLCKPFPYVRIDYYEAKGQIYFGEFTFFPASGMPDFIPSEWDTRIGELLTLPHIDNTKNVI